MLLLRTWPFVLLTCLWLLACGDKRPPVVVPPDQPPILPSPEAPLYATGDAKPRDALVAEAVVGLPWQESLAGAAATLALESPFAPDISKARWAAVRAGYPHPLRGMVFRDVPVNSYPEGFVAELKAALKPGEELGLVRVRANTVDRWVALMARPRVKLEPFPREVPLHEPLKLAGTPGAPWWLYAPSGDVLSGSLPAEPALHEEGEWWLEIRSGGRTAVSVPVYVGVTTPAEPVLQTPGEEVLQPTDALDLAYSLLATVREEFGLPPLQEDATLETLARYPLEQALEGRWERGAGAARLRGAGFVGGPAGQMFCEAATVALCIDSLLWEPLDRQVLLEPGVRLVGAAVDVRTSGIALVFNVASE